MNATTNQPARSVLADNVLSDDMMPDGRRPYGKMPEPDQQNAARHLSTRLIVAAVAVVAAAVVALAPEVAGIGSSSIEASAQPERLVDRSKGNSEGPAGPEKGSDQRGRQRNRAARDALVVKVDGKSSSNGRRKGQPQASTTSTSSATSSSSSSVPTTGSSTTSASSTSGPTTTATQPTTTAPTSKKPTTSMNSTTVTEKPHPTTTTTTQPTTTTTTQPTTTTTTKPTTTTTRPTTTTTAASTSTSSGGGSSVVWEEHFNSLDTSRWKSEHSTYGDGNNELQCYQPSNVSVSGGRLILTAQSQSATCPGGRQRSVTSGMVRSQGLTFSPGQAIEFRVKLTPNDPDDQGGLWPAVWASSWAGSWPRGGELDWLEVMTAESPSRSVFSMHYADRSGRHELQNKAIRMNSYFSDSWHTIRFDYGYGGRLTWYLDGQTVFVVDAAETSQGYPAPFDQTIGEIKINLAIGGNPGPLAPGALGSGGATFEVDYIKVFNL